MKLQIRFLAVDDIPALLRLEQSKWEPHQAATADALRRRIATHPQLCIGAFCATTGNALASLFMCPAQPAMFIAPTRWENAAALDRHDPRTRSLFGISLSSNNAQAANALFKFFYPQALKQGWRDIYLGSPIPGFKKALERNPSLKVWEYAHATRRQEPLDPQLRYYFRKGLTQIVSIQANYFPHAESLDHGVILRGVIPLSRPAPIWKRTPLCILKSMSAILPV